MVSIWLQAQEKSVIDFTKINAEILPIPESKEINGQATYTFELKAKTDSIFLDAVDMTIFYVAVNDKEIPFSNSGSRLGIKAPENLGQHELFVRYLTKPEQTVYSVHGNSIKKPTILEGPFSNNQIEFHGFENPVVQVWTQGQGKYTSHWLPSFDDMTEKLEFDISIVADKGYEVIANGRLISVEPISDDRRKWHFDMMHPMSSYLAAFVIGDFEKKMVQSASGVPIELYYEPKDSLKVEPTYRYTKEIFDFLEEEIGVPYPWQNYKQVPVQDFLYAGMENTTCTIFSNQYVIDSTAFVDKNYVNVNAHELAHQWFGNLVTEESGEHHWLHEGFATYYAYLAEQHLFGDEHFYWKLYQTARTLHNLSENGDGEALTNPNANSLTFYEKGAWALVMLKDKVGEEAFKNGVKSYLQKHEFKNVTITDFLKAMESSSNKVLTDFKFKWLESEDFPWEEVKNKLRTASENIDLLFKMEEDLTSTKSDDIDYMSYWKNSSSSQFKANFIGRNHRVLPDKILNQAFDSEDIKVRQALAKSLLGISGTGVLNENLIAKYETLLSDSSYITIENALVKLWSNFPEKRGQYLNKTKGIVGLPNKNIRLLWLTLALITPDYKSTKKAIFLEELNAYTLPNQHFEVRQMAFQYLKDINALSDRSLVSLIKACNHHVWQFKKSSRNLLRELFETSSLKNRLLNLEEFLSQEEQEILLKIQNQ